MSGSEIFKEAQNIESAEEELVRKKQELGDQVLAYLKSHEKWIEFLAYHGSYEDVRAIIGHVKTLDVEELTFEVSVSQFPSAIDLVLIDRDSEHEYMYAFDIKVEDLEQVEQIGERYEKFLAQEQPEILKKEIQELDKEIEELMNKRNKLQEWLSSTGKK